MHPKMPQTRVTAPFILSLSLLKQYCYPLDVLLHYGKKITKVLKLITFIAITTTAMIV